MKNSYNLAACVLWTCAVFALGVCPESNTISPCTCSEIKDGISVHCTGPTQENIISSALGHLQTTRTFDLHLESMDLEELPVTVRNVSSLRLNKCTIDRLFRTTPLLWPKLYEIVIESANVLNSFWSQLKGAQILRYVKVNEFPMPTIGEEFRNGVPAVVAYLDLRNTRTTRLQPGCMSNLKNLLYLSIVDVPLTEFSRDALPLHMSELHTFILGNTQIDKLEPKFFDGMPKLEVLMISGNQLTTLDSQLFRPLSSHLTHLLAERNPLECDCNLLWLKKSFQKNRSIKVLATCYDNSTKEFREVMTLDKEEYCLQDINDH